MSSDSSDSEEQGDEQQITGANADPQVLQYFWDLASLEPEERQAAASSLVTALVDSQQHYDATNRPADVQPGGTLGGTLDQQEGGNRQQRMEQCLNCCSPLMAYGLKRLARGLASSRQGARQGFAAALAATLTHAAAAAAAASAGGKSSSKSSAQLQLPFVSAAGVLALLDACLEVTGSMKGSDQRDALLGRVFGLAALARSGLVTALPAAPPAGTANGNSSSSTALRGVSVVADQLVGLLQRKVFLRESAAASLVELLQPLNVQQMQQVLSHAPKLTALLQVSAASASPESLFVALRLWHNLPQQQLQHVQLLPALPAGAAPPPELFWQQPAAVQRSAVAAAAAAVFGSVGHVQLMCPALLASSASQPRLHPVWGCLLALLVPGFVPVKVLQQQTDAEQDHHHHQQRRAAPDTQQLTNLWQQFVEASCFSSSHERKALALQLLQLLLPVLTPDSVPVLLSKQLLGCLATALRNKDSYLHASAKKCMDRITSCADHSLVAKGDPALAAKLRLALAAALQSANLPNTAVASSTGKVKGQQGLLQGLDAAGVAAYVDQLLDEFVAAVSRQGAAMEASDNEEDEEMEDADAGVDSSKARQLLDQLAAALRFPAADSTTLRKGLTFLTAAAFLRLPQGFNAATLATAAAAAAGDAAAVGSKSASKGKKKKGGEAAAGGGDGNSDNPLLLEQQVLQLAAVMQPQPPQDIRQQCAARLITLLHSLQHKAVQQSKHDASKKQQQQQDGKDDDAAAAAGETKKQKKARQQAEQEQAAAAARQAAWQQQEALTAQMLKLVTAAQQLQDVQPAADEDITEMVQQLQQLEAAVVQHTKQQQPAAAAAAPPAAATRSWVVLQLLHQLQLQLLAGGLSAESAGSVVDDLEVSVVKGLGMSTKGLGIDKSAAALLAGSSGSEDEGENSQEGDSEDGSEDGESAWQDILLDLLIALLSSSSSDAGGGAGSRGRVLVPTAPLREACEAVFRAFAEEMTAQGLSDLLRVLCQRASEVIKPRDEEDEEVEMEVDGSEDADEADGSASELESEKGDDAEEAAGSSEDEEGDAQPAAAAAAGAGKKQDGKAATEEKDGSDDDDDDAADDDLDDDAMMRLDAQLGAAVRSMLSRSGGSAKERAAALLGLQLRVAALLEEWLKKCPRSPLVLQATLPLLRALVAARGAGGNPTLADRLASIITKQLSKCRPVLPADLAAATAGGQLQQRGSDGSDSDAEAETAAAGGGQAQQGIQTFEADIRKVLYYASREKDPRITAAASQALLVLLAAGTEAGGAAAAVVQAAAADALSDFFDKKKSRLQRQWCEQLLARCPDAVVGGDAPALKVLLTACSKGRNESIKSHAVQLLPVLLRVQQPQQQQAVLSGLQQQQALLAAGLGAAVAGPYKSKEQHAAAVKAVVQLLHAVQRLGPGKRLAELLGSETVRELGKVVTVVKAAGVPPRVESQLERLVDMAGLAQLVAAGKADPARLALLKKQRAALEGRAAAGRGQQQQEQQKQKQQAAVGESAGAEDGNEQQQQNGEGAAKKGKTKEGKQGAGKKGKASAAAASEGEGGKNHKGDKGKHKAKQQAGTLASEQAAGGKRKKDGEEGKSKKKHKKQQQ